MFRFVYGYTEDFVDWLWARLQQDLQLGRPFRKPHLLELLRGYKQNSDYHEMRTRCGGSFAQTVADLEIRLHDFLLEHPYIPQSLLGLPRFGGNGPFRNVIGHVDVFPIRIRRPSHNQGCYYQPKYKSHVVKIQAVVDLRGRIVHVSLPWIGARHDLYIYRETVRLGELVVPPGTRLMADLGYASGGNRALRLITPHKRVRGRVLNDREVTFNQRHASLRSIVERAFGFLKRFDFL
ncbi:hypothetical protein FOZ60_006488, partial [Perkinsus olseni]